MFKRVYLTGEVSGSELINADLSAGNLQNWIAQPTGSAWWEVKRIGIWTQQVDSDHNELAGLTLSVGFLFKRGYKKPGKSIVPMGNIFGSTAFKTVNEFLGLENQSSVNDSSGNATGSFFKIDIPGGFVLQGSHSENIYVPLNDNFSTLAPSNGVKIFIDVIEHLF